ncbi:MAG TPA: VOC family protein [Polyangiaceae bacterium]|nr:VOC family protein [Polyangiaceae bacterium]
MQITVAPEDAPATLAFYENVVGLRRVPKSNSRTGGWFELGDLQLHVGAEASTSRSASLASKRHVCFRVTDLAAAERALRDAGVDIHPDPDPAPGWRRFYVRDPGGNRVEIAQRI